MEEYMKKLWRMAGTALVLSAIVAGMFFLSEGIIQINRNGQDEFIINLHQQPVTQTLETNHTQALIVYLLPRYQNETDSSTGIRCEVQNGEKKIETFIPISSLRNNSWTNICVTDPQLKDMRGETVLRLSGIGLNEDNDVQMIICTTNNNTALFGQLYLDDKPEDGILSMVYPYFGFRKLVRNFAICFIFIFCIGMAAGQIVRSAACSGLILLAVFRYTAGLLLNWPFNGTVNTFWSTLYLYNWRDMGVTRRSFPGTLISLFDSYLTVHDFWIYGLVMQLITVVFLCIFFKMKSLRSDKMLEALLFMYVSSPFFINYFTQQGMFGGYDILLLFYLLACYLLIHIDRFLPGIPVICFCAIITHEMYALFSLPFLLLLLLFQWKVNKKKNYFFPFISTALVSCGITCYLFFLSEVPYKQMEDIIQVLSSRADSSLILPHLISYYYFTGIKDQLFADFVLVQQLRIPFHWLVGMLLVLPLTISLFRFFWYWTRLHAKNGGIEKLTVNLFWICPAGFIAGCIKACDWGRWSILFFSSVIFTIVQINDVDHENASASLDYAFKPLKQLGGKGWLMLSCCYLLILGVGDTACLTPLCESLSRLVVPFLK